MRATAAPACRSPQPSDRTAQVASMGGEKLETNALTGITKQATMSRLPASTKSSKVHPAKEASAAS